MTGGGLRLRFTIPALVCAMTLMLVVYLAQERIAEFQRHILTASRDSLEVQMSQLQGSVADMLLQGERPRIGNLIASAALDRQVVTLLFADDHQTIISANRRELVDTPAHQVAGYDSASAREAVSSRKGRLLTIGWRFHGYYPVPLALSPGELRPSRYGILYVEYDYSAPFARAQQTAYRDALQAGALLLLFAGALSFLLHLLVSRPVERLMVVANAVKRGEKGARTGLRGTGELARVGQALDAMMEQLVREQEALHEQAVLLEAEIAERQAAQESLQEQAVQLELEISERRQAEETLALSEEKFSKAFENAPLMMAISRMEDGTFLEVNRRFLEQSGFDRAGVIGRTSLELGWITPEDRDRIAAIFRRDGRVAGLELTTRTRWGKSLTITYYGELITMAGHRRILSICLDITEQRSLEAQLRQAQKMEAIGQLAGGVAHDFNNILQVVLGYGNLLYAAPELGAAQKEQMGHIISAAEKGAHLTNGLLAFSRKQVMTPRQVNLNDVVRNLQKFLTRIIGEDIRLELSINEPVLTVLADTVQIDQVLLNLAANARDAMPDGGVLAVGTRLVEVDAAFVEEHHAGEPGRYACISVADTGVGMDRETAERIFEPFFTTKAEGKGTGLGMAIVYGIIRQHKGFITITSRPGEGTTFHVYLPLVVPEAEAPFQEEIRQELPKGKGETILLAEDDDAVRNVMEIFLKLAGYNVLVAVDGAEAVEQFAARNGEIALVVMDMIMPKKSGKEAFTEIKRRWPDARVLYTSGYPRKVIQEQGHLDGGESFIVKPVHAAEFLGKVRTILDTPSGAHAA